MPALYCRPVNNLANRMISIVSAHRLASLWGYDFHLIWDYGPESLFASAYSELFDCQHLVLEGFPAEENLLYTPKKSNNGREFYSKPIHAIDVLLDGWSHFTLDESDRDRSALEITSLLQAELRSIFRPTDRVHQCCMNLGYGEELFDFGIHIRRGAPEFDSISENIELLGIAKKIIAQNRYSSFFISCSDFRTADDFALELKGFGKCFVSRSFSNQPCFRNHALAIYDLIFFSRCKEILKIGATTFSSLGALLGHEVILNTVTGHGEPIRHPALYSIGAGL